MKCAEFPFQVVIKVEDDDDLYVTKEAIKRKKSSHDADQSFSHPAPPMDTQMVISFNHKKKKLKYATFKIFLFMVDVIEF